MQDTKRLSGKDFITVGIYTAMYIAVFFVFGLLTAIPVVYPFLLFLIPFICGIPMMLYYSKIEKFGMLSITGIINGIFFFFMGYGWYALIAWAIAGIISDIVLKAGNYKSLKIAMLSYVVYALGEWGVHAPLFLAGKKYWDNIRISMGDQYADMLLKTMPSWMIYASVGILALGAICGALLGRKMLKKHFIKAGIV